MKAAKWYRLALLGILAGTVIVFPAAAQQASGAAQADSAPDEQAQPLFEVNIQVVTVPVTVTDSAGHFVTDLNQSDFRLQDDGKEQSIEGFDFSWEPLSMVILVETSSRVQGELPEIARSGILFTQLILGESGEAAVLSFDSNVNLVQDFTTNSDLIENAMKSLRPGGDQVRLSDAMARALFLLNRRPRGRRKVIVVLSEARDNGSKNNPGYVLRGAQQLGVSVYTIGLNSSHNMFNQQQEPTANPFPPGVAAMPLPPSAAPTPDNENYHYGVANVPMLPIIKELVSYGKNWLGGNPLTLLASGTGATEFSTGEKTIEDGLERIGLELHNQYLLTYKPNDLDGDAFHSIEVEVLGRHVDVRARPGYMYTRSSGRGGAPPPPAAASASAGQ